MRKVITSQARALEIVEAVAAKHGMEVARLMAQPFKRDTVLARGEVVSRLSEELNWPFSMIAGYLGCSASTAHSAKSEWKKAEAAFAVFIPDEAVLAIAKVTQSEALQRAAQAERQLREIKGELDRVAGLDLSERMVVELDLLPRCAILLSIVAAAYPRYVRAGALLELYDQACERLNYGQRSGATIPLISKNAQTLREHFAARDWPCPIQPGVLPGSRQLTNEAAAWLHGRVGSPRMSQIVHHTERTGAAI